MIVQILLFAIVGIAVHKYEAWLESEEIFKAQTEGERKISFKTHKPEISFNRHRPEPNIDTDTQTQTEGEREISFKTHTNRKISFKHTQTDRGGEENII